MPNETSPPSRPLFYRPSPGFWRTRYILKQAKKFQDLIRHRERWASDIDLAQPLKKLLPGIPEALWVQSIDLEIGKLQRPVHWALNHFGVSTSTLYKDRYAPEAEEPRRYDLVLDYFRLPRVSGETHAPFEAVMSIMNQGIGVVEVHKRHTAWNLINPISWIAYLIRLPITVMERAGFMGNEKTEEMMLGAYAKFMRLMMAAVVTFAAIRLGVKIPWKELVAKYIETLWK
jgi:hypothetical protein